MATYALCGKVGSGKSLISVFKAHEAFGKQMRVATNLDLKLEYLTGPKHRQSCVRLPDHPTRHDLDAIGDGSESPDEDTFGYLIIDEGATFLNSRKWQGEERELVVEWFRHVRKHGWHLYLIIQDISSLDKQIREAIIEHMVICRRTDRMPIPFVGGLLKLVGFTGKFLKMHLGIVKYGLNSQSLTVDRWWYHGAKYYNAYDTRQIFDGNRAKGKMLHSVLSVYSASWLKEPAGPRESIYKFGQRLLANFPGLADYLPDACSQPSAKRIGWLQFMIADTGYLPRHQKKVTYAEWLASMQAGFIDNQTGDALSADGYSEPQRGEPVAAGLLHAA